MISFFVRMNEVFFQVNDTQSSASFVHDVREDIHFNFGALIVTLHRSDYFDCIVFAINDIEAFESSPKCTITQVRINSIVADIGANLIFEVTSIPRVAVR